ncbi:hypothetical protein [Streptomyces sp. NPDC005898]|uniref:hypothetical protein n=1 Tax=Streptomyces sp. NPDC005898 TaxID=3157082 RepID=UPI0033DCDC1B
MRTDLPSLVVHDSARDPEADIWFAEPAGFTAVPLDVLLNVPDSPESDPFHVALGPVLDTAPDELARQRFLAHVGAARHLLSALCEAGTVYCAIGLHRDDTDVDRDAPGEEATARAGDAGRPLLSFLTLSWRDIAIAPPSVTAARAVASGEGAPHTRVEYVEGLACGPVSLSETVRTPVPGGLGAGPLLQIHAHLPHPDGRRIAVLTLSTRATHRRDDYRRILRGGIELVSFENPLPPGAV